MNNTKNKTSKGLKNVNSTPILLLISIFIFVEEIFAIYKNEVNIVGLILAALLLILSLVNTIKNCKCQKNRKIFEETIELLGDAYYAIYKINLKKGTYDCIKTTKNIAKDLGDSGSYEHLIKTLEMVSVFTDRNNYIKRFHENKIMGKKDGPVLSYSGEFKRKVGDEYKWANVQIIQDRAENPSRALWCFKFVDDEKKHEMEHSIVIQDTMESVEKKSQEKAEFFSQASHDMRTPLNAILGYTNLSKSHQKNLDDLIDYMSKIESSANQLLELINDVLEYSKFGEDINNLNTNDFNLKETIDNLQFIYEDRLKIADKTMNISMDIVHECVIGDEFKLTQILKNLVTNSINYSNNGSFINITVSEVTANKHAKYQIIVEDNGIGMSEEFLKNIYEPYAREGQKLSNRETIGTGLGMVIVKNLVHMMNGQITVESKLGVGTKVIVTLPFEISEEEIKHTLEEKNMDENVSKDDELKFLNNMNILVVEDNELNMEILAELLKMRGVNVIKAWNGQEAVIQFEKSDVDFFDCILMDMNMPVMDGCKATETIRSAGRSDSKTVPIFAVTANAFAEDIDKITSAGMNGLIPKPVDFDLLYKLLKNYLECEK